MLLATVIMSSLAYPLFSHVSMPLRNPILLFSLCQNTTCSPSLVSRTTFRSLFLTTLSRFLGTLYLRPPPVSCAHPHVASTTINCDCLPSVASLGYKAHWEEGLFCPFNFIATIVPSMWLGMQLNICQINEWMNGEGKNIHIMIFLRHQSCRTQNCIQN